MILELTDAEAAVIDGALVLEISTYGKAARAFRTRAPKMGEKYAGRVSMAEGLRHKILVAKYGAERAGEIARERATVPTLEELYNGVPANPSEPDTDAAQGAAVDRDAANPSGVLTCFGTDETIPFCNGTDCPEWGDCHGDRLRGYSETDRRGALR